MKKLLLLCLLLMLSACSAGLSSISDAERSVRTVEDISGRSADVLMADTRDWIEEHFTAQSEPVLHEDQEEGVIVGNGQIPYPCSWMSCVTKGDWFVKFVLFVKIEDSKVMTSFRELQLSSPPSDNHTGMVGPVWSQKDMDAIRPKLLELHNSLIRYLQRKG